MPRCGLDTLSLAIGLKTQPSIGKLIERLKLSFNFYNKCAKIALISR